MDPDQRSVIGDHQPGTQPEAAPENETRWRRGLNQQDVDRLNRAEEDHSAIVEEIPLDKASLGAFSVLGLVFNRMTGSGIFNSSSVIFYNTQSIGVSLLIWLYGMVMAISGLILYIELGLTVPRWRLPNGIEMSTPRSGAELVYFNYFLKVPKYLATCLFGISFLVFGNTATNSVAFAVAVLQATGVTITAGKVVGIAIAVNTFSCLLHSMSRKWGIWLNNLLGGLKLLMLVLMVIIGFVFLDTSISNANFNTATSFSTTHTTPTSVYRYAEALVYVIFPFGGFHQANYVLAEIQNPRRNFAWISSLGVGVICILFMLINILYAANIPKEILFQGDVDVALEFFKRTIGRAATDITQVETATASLRALSAIGNVIVFTFTAARVKQEVAKEGVFPFSLYLAASYEFSLSHGFPYFRHLPAHEGGHQLYRQKAPAATLLLHWTVTTTMILAAMFGTAAQNGIGEVFSHLPGYSLLLTANSYGLDIMWFTIIGVSMLLLRLTPGSTWRQQSPVPHILGVLAAFVFTVTNAVPLIAVWVPDPTEPFISRSDGKVRWYAFQTMAITVLAAAALYWVIFKFYLWQKRVRYGLKLKMSKSPVFWENPARPGGISEWVLWYEIIVKEWIVYVPRDKRREENESAELAVLNGGQRTDGRDYRASTVRHSAVV